MHPVMDMESVRWNQFQAPYCCHQGYDGQKYDVASQPDRTDKYKG